MWLPYLDCLGDVIGHITLLAKVLSKPEIVAKIEIDSAKNKDV
jgi:hypothetical protein